ncbi:hypothetical protein EN780_00770 [Mesorhizobium sp. M4B.F.Ca.ET.089.01.1.1]|uniref:hypothetical protein n=1 Tax=Mesorhizobium sp. M4B.F.Ca.ET.089.01.1.1 TaxID=2496662 RepID=UPI000FE31211|nr:hypothetical protein [Mesorhizobium sp. M4B.F.Ca.ET.089.01.1.1]RWX71293.1 hypothetical protein EN780_00770 [Mesorhizobium sp. M4B.F.Ca.ET.089.01.1.1]
MTTARRRQRSAGEKVMVFSARIRATRALTPNKYSAQEISNGGFFFTSESLLPHQRAAAFMLADIR